MYINVEDFDKITVFMMNAKKGRFSQENWQEWGEIYKKTLLRYKHQNRQTANRIAEKRKTNKNYCRGRNIYSVSKARARDLAIEWKLNFEKQPHSWWYCIEWKARFERIGKKYGLLREFRENCII